MIFKKKKAKTQEPELSPLQKFLDYECRLAVLVNVAINESDRMSDDEYKHACTIPVANAIAKAEADMLNAFRRFVDLLDETQCEEFPL